MPRIKLQLPSTFTFSAQIPVRISDVNYGNHLGNDAVLSIIHEARMQYLKGIAASELDFFGVSLIMADAAIEFRSEAFYGDVLTVHVAAAEVSRVGFDLFYKIVKGEESIVAVAKTGMICFDYKARKVVGVPEEARRGLGG